MKKKKPNTHNLKESNAMDATIPQNITPRQPAPLNPHAALLDLYQVALLNDDHTLAFRILQALPKAEVDLPELSSLCDKQLQELIEKWEN
jgi:hypothetical protein